MDQESRDAAMIKLGLIMEQIGLVQVEDLRSFLNFAFVPLASQFLS